MHPAAQQAPFPMTLLIYAVVIALFVWRTARPQRTSVLGLWFRPILLVVLTGFVIWSANFATIASGQIPPPSWEVALVLVLGAALGVPLGVLRGRHSVVKPTERPGVMYVHSSPVIIVIWIAALLARAVLRYLLPGAQSGAGIWGDGLLAFAVAALITSAFMIYAKYRDLTAKPQPA
jgi:hypothetical protein